MMRDNLWKIIRVKPVDHATVSIQCVVDELKHIKMKCKSFPTRFLPLNNGVCAFSTLACQLCNASILSG